MKLYDEERFIEEHVAGDNPGMMSVAANRTPQVRLRYRDHILVGEVYSNGDGIMLNILCPKCKHSLRIQSCNKAIDWDRQSGRISVERSKCTWEMDSDATVGVTYTNLCNFVFAIDNNIIKDA